MPVKNRLNVLISRPIDGTDSRINLFSGVTLDVRWGWTPLEEDAPEAAGRPVHVGIRMPIQFNPTARNSIGRLGAFEVAVDVPMIERALADLLGVWGEIPVQDNSGHCSHLASAPASWP